MIAHNSVASLLAAQGLERSQETPLEHAGFSGAILSRLTREDNRPFILKRMSLDRDWIMRATDDVSHREARFAETEPGLGALVRTPTVGVAHDADGFAILMDDISDDLIDAGDISVSQLEAVIAAMASLHTQNPPAGFPWCDIGLRLGLLAPTRADIAESYGAPVARDLRRGWQAFDRLAPRTVKRLVNGLHGDMRPLVERLNRLPPAFLHGDLKLDNIGIAPAGHAWFLDWAMPMVASTAVELGWFIAVNSRRLPLGLDETLHMYRDASAMPESQQATHDSLAALCGLVLRGWRKALDAENGTSAEFAWWCERAEKAATLL